MDNAATAMNAGSGRYLDADAEWPARPWIWAAIGCVAAMIFGTLIELDAPKADNAPIWAQVAAVFIFVCTMAFIITAERRRLAWAVGFAVSAGIVIAFVGWFTASYNRGGSIGEFPFFAGIFAGLLAAPLFQTVRDEGTWRFPYARLHSHVWTDAVIGAASLAFMGLCFGLANLIAELFNIIGITFLRVLLGETWFGWGLAGLSFGGVFGILRERDALVGTLQKLVLFILSMLAPVLAFALAMFLLSLPFTGLAPLWKSGLSSTAILLVVAAGAVGLVNAVIGDGKTDGSRNRILRGSAFVLSITVLPLAIIAAASMGARIGQYGWTPDRIWGLLATIVATFYGVAYLVAAVRAVLAKAVFDWDDYIRPANIHIAIGVCGLALFLALPILDFGGISARDQMARLKSGVLKIDTFDWRAMAFEFGPKGRAQLDTLAKSGVKAQQESAKAALAANERYEINEVLQENGSAVDYSANFQIQGNGPAPDDDLKKILIRNGACRKPCRIVWLATNRVIVVGPRYDNGPVDTKMFYYASQADINAIVAENKRILNDQGTGSNQREARVTRSPPEVGWSDYYGSTIEAADSAERANKLQSVQPNTKVEIRDEVRRRVYVNGLPVGDSFEK